MSLKYVVYALLLTLSQKSHAGSERGNGGDALFCDPAKQDLTGLDTIIFLDYAWSIIHGYQVLDQDIEIISDRIVSSLSSICPEYGVSYQSFITQIQPHNMVPNSAQWSEVANLPDVSDEGDLDWVPSACRYNKSKRPILAQLAVRTFAGDKESYLFNPKLYRLLRVHPIQLSFFMLHEWLHRHLTGDPASIRFLNSEIHKVSQMHHSHLSELASILKKTLPCPER